MRLLQRDGTGLDETAGNSPRLDRRDGVKRLVLKDFDSAEEPPFGSDRSKKTRSRSPTQLATITIRADEVDPNISGRGGSRNTVRFGRLIRVRVLTSPGPSSRVSM